MSQALALVRRGRDVDFEATEKLIRTAALEGAAKTLSVLFDKANDLVREREHRCPLCGRTMHRAGMRARRVTSILGDVTQERTMYRCPCGATAYPADELLDVAGTSRSPGVRRMTARLGARESFADAAEDLRELAGITVSAKDCERSSEQTGADVVAWEEQRRGHAPNSAQDAADGEIPVLYIEMDGTGVPVVSSETAGRKGKTGDGTAKTREAKIGCVFTQTGTDEKGAPVRDAGSTTFSGAVENAEAFAGRILAEARRRGLERAQKVVILSDGAEWIANIAADCFPGAVHILDLYHALEHLASLCALLFGKTTDLGMQMRQSLSELLRAGEVTQLLELLRPHMPGQDDDGRAAWEHFLYLGSRAHIMRYAEFREQKLFVGSGVIEAGCKNVVGKRLKQSGMRWKVDGANKIIALRCAVLNRDFEDFWADRTFKDVA